VALGQEACADLVLEVTNKVGVDVLVCGVGRVRARNQVKANSELVGGTLYDALQALGRRSKRHRGWP
jgi:hypothetical protein